MMNPNIRVGVDIGGTFTDVALQYPGGLATAKVLTNYSKPEQAILDGILKAADAAGVGPAEIGQVIHGTTLVTNSLIERRGPSWPSSPPRAFATWSKCARKTASSNMT